MPNYDYSKCMMMKILLAEPDRKGGSVVHTSLEKALDIICQVDNMSLGIKKIVYLVGWQYNGHDDRYPDFFEVNKAIKRECDDSALQSLLWLIEESKKYNTVISLHINWCDAYENAPSFEEFVKNKALIRDKKGNPKPIENYNGLKCYKTSLKEYWESGLFKRQFDRLLNFLPIEKQGTLHVDNFQCYTNYAPNVSISEMQAYRKKMILYAREKGIDITTEFTLREHNSLKNKPIFGLPREHSKKHPIDVIGLIPAVWWLTTMNKREYIDFQADVYCGGLIRKGKIGDFLYGNIHGEDIFLKADKQDFDWQKEFMLQFATVQLPHYYLNHYKRLSINGKGGGQYCQFEDSLFSYRKGQKIAHHNQVIKDGNTLCMKHKGLEDTYVAYSDKDAERVWQVFDGASCKISIYEISQNGKTLKKVEFVKDGVLKLNMSAYQMLLIVKSI